MHPAALWASLATGLQESTSVPIPLFKIYDPILYLFHKIHIFSAGVVLANQLLTWGLYLVWPGEQSVLFILCPRLAVKIPPSARGCGWTKLLARGLCAWSALSVCVAEKGPSTAPWSSKAHK